MSILNVDKIQPIGGGSTITVDATDIQASTGTITASTFSGDVSATGIGVTSLNIAGVTTTTDDIKINADNKNLKIGAGEDLSLFHNGTDSRIVNTTGDLSIRSNSLKLASTTGEEYLRATANSSVDLFHDNVVKLTTNSDGYRSNDNVKAQFGNASDLTIFHDSNRSAINNATGELRILSGSDIIIGKRSAADSSYSEQLATFKIDGAVELYHNNVKKFETTSAGADFSLASGGQVNLYHLGSDGGLRISGPQSASSATLFFNTNHQNVSGGADYYTITCSGANHTLKFKRGDTSGNTVFELSDIEHVLIPQDGKALKIGAGQDLSLHHTGGHSYIDNNTGSLRFRDAGGAEKFRISGTGTFFNDDITLSNDNDKINIGAGSDLQLYHDSTANFNNIQSLAGSNLRIRQQTNGAGLYLAATNIYLQNHNNNQTYLHAQNGSSVSLYNNNERKLFTKENGVQVEDTSATGAYLTMATSSGTAGKLYATGNTTLGFLDSQNHYMLKGVKDGALELYHNNVKVVKTNSWGMQVGAKATNDNYSHTTTDGWALADGWTKAVFTSNVAGNSPFTIYNAGSSYNRYMCYFKFDGGFANYSSNDINLCDERVKKDFAEVPSQWNNIKNIGFKHFRYKEDSSSDPLKIGVVAQQVESVYPDLIDENWPQENGNPNTGEGDFYKGVKEEQLLMYSVKALQEAQARIETLEAEVATLKGS